MKVWAYAICWNEIKMLPYYIKHYESFCEKIIIYDNESTDGSRRLIKEHPKCELRTYKTGNQIKDSKYLEIKNNCWQEARKIADYVIVGDMDEFIYHPNILEFLKDNQEKYSLFKPAGFQMVSDSFPREPKPLTEIVKIGTHHGGSSKPIIFCPTRLRAINFRPGCHNADPKMKGKKWWFRDLGYSPEASPLKLLHYKFLSINYVVGRYNQMSKRLSVENRKRGWGFHYRKPYHWINEEFKKWKKKATKII